MKKYLIITFLLLIVSALSGQGIYNNGGNIIVGSGVTIYISGSGGNFTNETNGNDGSVTLAGTLKIEGNLINNVAAADVFSSVLPGSELVLKGTGLQILGGSTTASYTVDNLTVNNSAGVSIHKDLNVNGNLSLTTGLLDIGNNNFRFGPQSSVTGTPSVTGMIIATGTGQVLKEWQAAGSFTFPVGDKNVTAHYSPVSLNFTSGTFSPGAITGLNLVNDKYNDPLITGSYLNRYWNISQTGINGFSCDVVFGYESTDVVGDENLIGCLRVNPAPFTPYNPSNVSLNLLTASGLSSFGTFTGALGYKTLSLKLFLEGFYAGGGTMNQSQGSSGNQYPGNTVDKLTVELHDPITYSTNIYSVPDVDLSTTGSANVSIPLSYNGSYYVTVKHRNSIGVVTASPVLFSTAAINYDFTTDKALAFGGNMKAMSAGVYALSGGDSNGDGTIDVLDLSSVQNSAVLFGSGYTPEDINGDGMIDAFDLSVVQNNSLLFIMFITP